MSLKIIARLEAQVEESKTEFEHRYAAKLESLQASHATTLAALKSDHSNQLSALELSLQAANAQVEEDQVKLEGVVEERDVLVEQVKRLEIELEGVNAGGKSKSNEDDGEVEAELKKVKAELQHVSDELAGALEVSTHRTNMYDTKCECRCRR